MKHDFNFTTDGSNRDAPARAELSLRCEVRHGTRPWKQVNLDDLSQAGFRIAWLPDASPGQTLKIRIPGLQPLDADIRWQQNKTVGCAFSAPLHVAVFEHILRQVGIQAD